MEKYKKKVSEISSNDVPKHISYTKLNFPILNKKIKEIRKLNKKEIIGIVMEDDSGLIVKVDKGKLQILPVSKFSDIM